MKTARTILAALFAIAVVPTACKNDDSRGNSVEDSGTNGNTDNCPLDGTWLLVSYHCGTTDITQSWLSVVSSTTVEFTGTASGCHALLTNRSANCTETEVSESVMGKNTFEQTSNGIESCNPEGCTFAPSDAPCVVGDRAGETTTTTYTLTATTLTLTTVSTTNSLCGAGLEQILTFEKQ